MLNVKLEPVLLPTKILPSPDPRQKTSA